jgi:hypothetical protein
VRGEIKDDVSVTPEMLKNPPPEDLLIFRGNYHGWSRSTSGAIVIGDKLLQGMVGCGRNATDGC